MLHYRKYKRYRKDKLSFFVNKVSVIYDATNILKEMLIMRQCFDWIQ